MKKIPRDEKELEEELKREKKEEQFGSPDAAPNLKPKKADNWDERERRRRREAGKNPSREKERLEKESRLRYPTFWTDSIDIDPPLRRLLRRESSFFLPRALKSCKI